MANALKAQGVKKGDRVVIYMSMSVEGVVAMQACARIGATHSVVFGGFSAQSLRDRIEGAGAVMVITADEQLRGGKQLPLKAIVDEAIGLGGCDSIKSVVVYKRTGGDIAWNAARDRWMHELTAAQPDTCEPEWVGAEHPLFLLYTSGSTGKPKGVQHSTGGYLLMAALTTKWTFDMKPDDCLLVHRRHRLGHRAHLHRLRPAGARRDRGRVRGRADLPGRRRFWKMIQDHKVTVFYTAPTAIRSLIKAAESNADGAPEALRPVEPAHPRHGGRADQPGRVGLVPPERRRRPLPDRRHLLADRDRRPHDHAAAGRDAAGAGLVHAAVPGHRRRGRRRDRQGRADGQGGILVVKKPGRDDPHDLGRPRALQEELLPGRASRAVLPGRRRRDPRREDRLLHDHRPHRRRAQRVGPPHGHDGDRVGAGRCTPSSSPRRRSSAARRHHRRGDLRLRRAEAPAPERRRGQEIAKQLRDWVGKEIGPIAKPKDIRFGDNLPKTRSGKIMRRLLRSVAKGEAVTQDTSTLENPAILEQLGQAY
jgi:acetyl-CoA synthetase